ncbi:sel1 repeat family protein [Vibrio parahaemolyticus]|uniref:sel1 repeat family protein n=1 Tax=Vibrio parahaemolyticus TaxID=670 RepID=UPI001469E6D5|nr:sel1 repeat family protein [Vibrio parahaemolyticus]MDF5022316.1 sel1 repeat family protein [Vibrio parahaemolyticus]MDF5041608.1 sel1 repeat family protein [Vibrio parahaemolyticus]MDF5157768.1 sel1 repeat family protein [Vibrio parahaemolyticus]MDF5161846.1 sel1 repeat family protein [Vibrio parahaemolyticus]MDF5171401.1 sel1 repeat family protein [Vibrio parahaemolyticus]
MCFSRLFVKSILLFGLALSMVGCSKAPDPQDDIPLFDVFIAENIDKVSDDPYISSTVRPGDKMYDFLVSLQHGSGGKNFLDPLLDNEDPEAMLWEGRLILPVMRLRGKAYRLIHGAMQAGNPYAALELSEGSESCRYYFGKNSAGNKLAEMVGMGASNESGVCSEENFALALKGFEELAKEGDLRAQYFLLKQKSWDKSTETRAEYIQEITRFAEAHYYQPLMDYVGTILFYSKEENKDISNTQEQRELAIKLLTIASNNNYIPAIYKLYFATTNKDEKEELINKSFVLGDIRMIKYQLFKEQDGSPEQYYYNTIIKELSGRYLFSPEESEKEPDVQLQAEKFAESIHASVYIDGFTDSVDWN